MQVTTWCLFLLVILLTSLPRDGHAQASAQIKLSAADVNAGDMLGADLKFDSPSPCDFTVVFSLGNTAQGQFLGLAGSLPKGKTEAHVDVRVGKDRDSDTYRTANVLINACPGYDKPIDIRPPAAQDISVTVHAISDPTVFPRSAGVVLSVTQRQFFDTKIDQLRRLEQQLATEVAGRGADRPELRQVLLLIIRDADHDLTVTQGQYSEQILKKGESLPLFFAEFHRRYAQLITKLEALPPDMKHVSIQDRKDRGQTKLPPKSATAETGSYFV